MEWFMKIIGFLGAPTDARAIVMAILGGLFATQWIKFQLPDMWTSDVHKRMTRIIGTMLTSAICLAMWPDDEWWVAGSVSLVIGLASPTLYWGAMKFIYHKWPWLNDMLSARPDGKSQP